MKLDLQDMHVAKPRARSIDGGETWLIHGMGINRFAITGLDKGLRGWYHAAMRKLAGIESSQEQQAA
jgi:hypothetical protein